MLVNVYGCGFAGIVSALGLCEQGHQVTGIDIDPSKIQSLLKGKFPGASGEIDTLIEKHLDRNLTFRNFGNEKFDADVAFVVLPTPFDGKSLATDSLKACCNHILQNRSGKSNTAIFIRSTLPLGGLSQIERILESDNQLRSGEDFHLFYYPEFMREGTGLEDVIDPPFTVIGYGKNPPLEQHMEFFANPASVQKVPGGEAEALKLFSNAFHAAKVTFANEVMRVCESNDLNSRNVMDLFCQDTKLNISSKYLKPGFAWGGGCLGKDTKALTALESKTPLLDSLTDSNSEHIRYFSIKVLAKSPASIGFIGASFKENVSDIRDSAVTELIRLCDRAACVRQIFVLEPNKELPEQLVGCDKVVLSSDLKELSDAEVIVCRESRYKDLKDFLTEDQICVQL